MVQRAVLGFDELHKMDRMFYERMFVCNISTFLFILRFYDRNICFFLFLLTIQIIILLNFSVIMS